MVMVPSRPVRSVQVRPVRGGYAVAYFRGIQFIRQVDAQGVCSWRMQDPIRGPVFPSMRAAARWCREHRIQSSGWMMGMPHRISPEWWDW